MLLSIVRLEAEKGFRDTRGYDKGETYRAVRASLPARTFKHCRQKRGKMKKYAIGIVSLLLLSGFGGGIARAQRAAAPGGMQADCIASVEEAEKKLVALAEAAPQEKYSWKPGEGVRSMGEVFTHVAVSNYRISTLLGAKIPE